jgi:NAD(P)H-hydrate repair Nnr-like enzyme with NAD(P)H-hydrate dehydratase domain
MQEGDSLSDLIETVLEGQGNFPLVLDAAALGLLRPLSGALRHWPGGSVLLPHRGEMARLLDCRREQVEAEPLAAARKASQEFGSVVLVKGEWSFVVEPGGRSFRYRGGGIGLATSGSGDALAGIVGGLCARGADPLTATLWGVYLHGEAGRRLGWQVGRVGFLARELLDHIPGLIEGRG